MFGVVMIRMLMWLMGWCELSDKWFECYSKLSSLLSLPEWSMLVCLVALMSNEGLFSLVSLMSKDYEGLFD